MRAAAILLAVLPGILAAAVEPPVLEPVVVATRAPRSLEALPFAVSVVDRGALDSGPGLGLDHALAGSAGFQTERRSEGLDDVKLLARGFGARAIFGVRETLVLVEGIPLTDPDGQTRLESLEPAAIDRIESLRGAAAGLHGGGAPGGALHVRLRDGDGPARGGAARTEGSFGLERTQAWLAGGGAFIAGSHAHARGWRHHAASSAARLTGAARLRLPDGGALTLVALGSSVDVLRPGPISAAAMAADPRQARPANVADNWSRHEDRLRVGGVLDRPLGGGWTAAVSGWADGRRLVHPIFRYMVSHRAAAGADARVRRDTALAGREAALTLGGSASWMRLDEQTYANRGGGRGSLLADEETLVRTVAGSLQAEWRAHPRVMLLGHARVDRHAVGLDDRFPADGDQSGGRAWVEWSPAAGAAWEVARELAVFANVAGAFSVPTLTELRSPLSGDRFGLSAARTRSLEAGLRWTPVPGWRAEAVGFASRTTGEILRQTIANRPYYRKAGTTRRAGAEASVVGPILGSLSGAAALHMTDARFDADPTYGSGRMPGVPPADATATLRWGAVGGPWAAVEGRWRARTWADDARTIRAAGWRTAAVRAGWRAGRWEVSGGVENLLNERYAAALAVNDASGNVFEPGDPRSYWVSASASF